LIPASLAEAHPAPSTTVINCTFLTSLGFACRMFSVAAAV
jgi:hypothetical protein